MNSKVTTIKRKKYKLNIKNLYQRLISSLNVRNFGSQCSPFLLYLAFYFFIRASRMSRWNTRLAIKISILVSLMSLFRFEKKPTLFRKIHKQLKIFMKVKMSSITLSNFTFWKRWHDSPKKRWIIKLIMQWKI